MIKFHNKAADCFVPDGVSPDQALRRTTHLGIGAHQDDLEILAFHGISLCYDSGSEWFSGVVIGDGAGSPRTGPFAGTSNEEMILLRREEQKKAARLGKYAAVLQLGYSSAEIKDKSSAKFVAQDLEQVLASTSMQVVYMHNPADSHDTHVAVVLRSIDALRRIPKDKQPQKVWGCEVWRDLDWLMPESKICLPVSERTKLAGELCAVFESQVIGGKRYDLATLARRTANATFSSSHETDTDSSLILAMDLMPLLQNPKLSIVDFTLSHVEKLKIDIRKRLEAF